MSPGDWWTSQNHADQKEWPKDRVHGWAPGGYSCTCRDCGIHYAGDKRSVQCYPCAAKFVPPPRPETTEERCNRPATELADALDQAERFRKGERAVAEMLAERMMDAENLRRLLTIALPHVEASAGAEHLFDGFRPQRRPLDGVVEEIRAALAQPQDGTT